MSRQSRLIQFGPELVEADLTAFLDVVAALPRRAVVTLMTIAREGQVEFWLDAPPATITASLEAALSGIAPHVLITPSEVELPKHQSFKWRLGWRGAQGALLRTDQSESAAASLLGSIASCGPNEVVRLSHQLRPAGRRGSTPKGRSAQSTFAIGNSALARKHELPGLHLRMEVEIWTGAAARARALLARIIAPLRSRTGSQGRLAIHRADTRLLRILGATLNGRHATVSSSEATALIGWPIGAPQIPGVAYDAAPWVSVSRDVPSARSARSRRAFGISNSPRSAGRLLVQPVSGATCHSLIVGPSGSGKSWLLTNLFAGDVAAGHAVVLVDMKGDTAEDALARIAPERRKDVVVFEPAFDGPLPGLRTFGGSPELAADLWLSVFRGLFPENFGVRSQRYLRMGLTTLARTLHDATIAELPRLFQDPMFRRSLVSRLDDPLLVGEWSAFEQLSIGQQSEHLLPALGKVSEVISRKSVRAVLAQSKPRITITEAIKSGKIVVVSLPPGVIGQPAAQLLGALVIFEVWQAVMAQQAVAAEARRHVGLYIDEPAVLGTLPIPLDTLLETARGMNCGITLAAQSLRQLPERVMRAALTNAATIATFRPSRADAKLLADELPGLTADQLQRLDPFTIALRLGLANGVVAPVATVRTLPLTDATSHPEDVRQLSAQQFGMRPGDVDAALKERLGIPEAVGPIGPVPLGETGGIS